jgi:hypothetical protein
MSDVRLDMMIEQEREVANALDRLIKQAETDAKALDTRTSDEMFRPLPEKHPAARLRYMAYRMKLAREALL